MPRMRTIKPQFFMNEELATVSYQARLFYLGLLVHADREGRLEYRPKRLKVCIFPYESAEVDRLLGELVPAFIIRYTAQPWGALLAVKNFLKHQKPHFKEAPSELPAPPAPQPRLGLDAHEGLNLPGQAPTKHLPDPGKAATSTSLAVWRMENGEWRMENGKGKPQTKVASPRERLAYEALSRCARVKLDDPGLIMRWAEAYPNVDIAQEISKAEAWAEVGKINRNGKRGWPRTLNTWLSKAQNQARTNPNAIRCVICQDRPVSKKNSICENCAHCGVCGERDKEFKIIRRRDKTLSVRCRKCAGKK